MKAAGFAGEEPAGEPAAEGQNLGQDGDRDFFRRLGADRKPDRAVDPAAHLVWHAEPFGRQVRQQPFVARPRPEHADVSRLPLQAEAQCQPVADSGGGS